MTPRPWTLVAELTYACPLRCAYCSNPVQADVGRPLSVEEWQRVLCEANDLGVVQTHFTGGEPLLYEGLEELVTQAHELGSYCSLITSGVPLTPTKLQSLARAGLEHVQLSLQGASSETSRRVAAVDKLATKLRAAQWVKDLGLSLTLNVVLHRENLHELKTILELAESLEPDRLELAHTQYLGWARLNQAQLLPAATDLSAARALIQREKERLSSRFEIISVLPDLYAERPRACMNGWAQQYLVVTPDGLLLPCQAAREIRGLAFDNVRSAPLAQLWRSSPALERYRGSAWMKEPCASCAHREQDFGGCRCQAFQWLGDASAPDPACALVPGHSLVREARDLAQEPASSELSWRTAPRP